MTNQEIRQAAWRKFKATPQILIYMSWVIYFGVSLAGSYLNQWIGGPWPGNAWSCLMGPLLLGELGVTLGLMRGEKRSWRDYFAGFRSWQTWGKAAAIQGLTIVASGLLLQAVTWLLGRGLPSAQRGERLTLGLALLLLIAGMACLSLWLYLRLLPWGYLWVQAPRKPLGALLKEAWAVSRGQVRRMAAMAAVSFLPLLALVLPMGLLLIQMPASRLLMQVLLGLAMGLVSPYCRLSMAGLVNTLIQALHPGAVGRSRRRKNARRTQAP